MLAADRGRESATELLASAGCPGLLGHGRPAATGHSRADQPAIRGPLLGNIVVTANCWILRGILQGSASISRQFPLLGRLGRYRLDAANHLLDDKWQHRQMEIPYTDWPRIPYIYTLLQPPVATIDAYTQAVVAIYYAPFRPQLAPLDHDDEFIAYGRLLGLGSPPDCYPRLAGFCSVDRSVADPLVQNLIDRIQGRARLNPVPSLAVTMTQAFLTCYNAVLTRGQAMITADQTQITTLNSISPQTPAIQAQIAELNAQDQ